MNSCLNCEKETRNIKFCSRSCSGLFQSRFLPKKVWPKGTCLVCDKPILARQKFCSHSHSATHNNKIIEKNYKKRNPFLLVDTQCLSCQNVFTQKTHAKKYCNIGCQNNYEYKSFILAWRNGDIEGGSDTFVSVHVRRYLLEKQKNCCALCGISSWQGESLTLQLDHIDGCHTNNTEKNLWMICANCHAQRPTSGSRNVGRGRKHRAAFSEITNNFLRAAHKKSKKQKAS